MRAEQFLYVNYVLQYVNGHAGLSPPNTSVLLLLTTWNGVNMFLKFLLKQLRLGFLRRNLALAPQHTKEVAYQTLVRPQLEYAAPIWHPYNETETKKVEKVQKTAARWACRRWHNKRSVDETMTCFMILTGHPWRTAGLSLP